MFRFGVGFPTHAARVAGTTLEDVMGIEYLHTMVRVKDLEVSKAFYELLGLEEHQSRLAEIVITLC